MQRPPGRRAKRAINESAHPRTAGIFWDSFDEQSHAVCCPILREVSHLDQCFMSRLRQRA
eukprot:7188996-Alexandrium_andersonii.AAC.1